MLCKLLLAACIAFVAFSVPSAKALVTDGRYIITLTGPEIDPSGGSFDVTGGNIENFSLNLLSGGEPAVSSGIYTANFLSDLRIVESGLIPFGIEGTLNSFDQLSPVVFSRFGTWDCSFDFNPHFPSDRSI